jgi:hypothetical protein
MGKAVGIFPLLWVALIIAAPRWKERDDSYIDAHLYSREDSNLCVFLYVIGMQSWLRPQCATLGPNTTLYASNILNVFLLYGLMRLLLGALQGYVMLWRHSSLGAPHKTWSVRTGEIATMWAYNRPPWSVAILTTIFWFVVSSGALLLEWAFMGWKNAVTYIPYFVAGSAAASVVESLHWARWNPHISLQHWSDVDLVPSTETRNPDTVESGTSKICFRCLISAP